MLKLATKFLPELSALEVAYQAGFRNAEFWLDADWLGRWQEIARLARHYPLRFVPHFPNEGNMEDATLADTAELYRALDCRAVVIHQPMFDKYQARLLQLEPTMRLAVENHRLTPARFEDWAEKNPGLTLDVEHLWKFTLEDAPLPELLARVREFLDRHHAKLRHVHLPGYVPGYEEHRPQYCSRDMVFGVLSLLAEYEFEGLVVSEVGPEFQNPIDLRMDSLLFDSWRTQHDPLARAAGLSTQVALASAG